MGKMNKKPNGNPLGSPIIDTVELLEEEGLISDEDEATSCAFILSILEQLTSKTAEERDSGLNSLSIICQKPNYMSEISKSEVVKTVGPLLLDPNHNVRHSASGALRNLSCVSSEFAEFMVKQDVLTHLVNLLRSYTTWKPNETKEDKIDTTKETLIQAVNLLTNLCESSESALKIFNTEKLAEFLAQFLNFNFDIAVPVAQCLYTASEDNAEIRNSTDLNSNIEIILSTPLDSHNLYLQTVVVGLSLNLHSGRLQNVNQSMQILSCCLEIDQIDLIKRFSSQVPIVGEKECNQNEFNKLMDLLNCQTLALEIISNLVFTEEIEEEIEDMDTECSDNDMDIELQTGQIEIHSEIMKNQMLHKVLKKSSPLPSNVVEILKENEKGLKILTQYSRERSTGLICLQNLIEAVELNDIEKNININEVWNVLGNLISLDSLEFLEAVTCAMRAVISVWIQFSGGVPTNVFDSFGPFKTAYTKMEVQKIRVNIIRIIGTMGQLIMKTDQKENLKQITEFLTSILPLNKIDKDNLWLVSETLDTIFDLFAEDEHNYLLSTLVKKMQSLRGSFNKVVLLEKRNLGEHKAVIQTANNNLQPFIQYKISNGV